MAACVTLIPAASSRYLHSSSSLSTHFTDGKTLLSNVWRVALTRHHRQVQMLCLESPTQFSHLVKNIVEHVHGYKCVLLAKSCAKAKCFWLVDVIIMAVTVAP